MYKWEKHIDTMPIGLFLNKYNKNQFDKPMILSRKRLSIYGRNNFTCSICGVRGTYFKISLIEELGFEDSYTAHLYGVDKNNKEVWFNLDHILPKSKGGKDNSSNMQCTCEPCNSKKKNLI